MRTHVYFADLFYFFLEAGLMTAKCQTQSHVATKVCQAQVILFTFNKKRALTSHFFFIIGLINPNKAVMESDNLHDAKQKVKIIKYYCFGASLSASCSAKCLIVISKYIRCSHK
jgi:hypothetical protein